MKKTIFTLLWVGVVGVLAAQPAQKTITGYYPSWRWYDRGKLVAPSRIDYTKYHILNYAFLNVEPDGSLSLPDPWADKNLLLGPVNGTKAPASYSSSGDLGNPACHKPGQRFSDYAHKNKVRFLVSIGGWAHSGNFSEVAASPFKRARFAGQCKKIIQLYNLDGIDIDWEYPGYTEQGGNPYDKQTFTLLIRQVRDSLNALAPKMKRPLLLTAAAGASLKRMEAIEWPQVAPLLDAVNLMAYAFYGHWDMVTNHNAPLFPPLNASQPGNSCSEAVQNLLDLGVPAAKINLGLAFYGRTQLTSGPANLHCASTGRPDSLNFGVFAPTPPYYEIANRLNLYDCKWDEVAQATYLTGKNGMPSFVSYDDERSIALKAQFIKSRNLRGAVVWDITADYIESAPGSNTIKSTPLANAIKQVFSNTLTAVPPILSGATICVFPNPTPNGYLQVFINAVERVRTELALFNTNGEKIQTASYEEASHRLDLRALPAGPYLVQIRRGKDAPVLVRVVKK